MTTDTIKIDETARLEALESYQLMNTAPEADYDEITALAAQICGTPIALVTLLGEEKQWFKSHHGLELEETNRDIAFCSHAILEENGVFIVNDATTDERFAQNPLVTGEPRIAFYAGVSLVNPEGHALGTLCVIGHQPRELSQQQLSALKTLSKHALMLMEMRRKNEQLERQNKELTRTNTALQEFARKAVHDIKNPLTSVILNSQAVSLRLKGKIDERTFRLVEMNITSAKELSALINKLLEDSLNNKFDV